MKATTFHIVHLQWLVCSWDLEAWHFRHCELALADAVNSMTFWKKGSLDSRISSTWIPRIKLDIFFREGLLDDFWRLPGCIWRLGARCALKKDYLPTATEGGGV